MKRLTVKEAADYLGVSRDSIYKMVREKQIPNFRVRSTILFSQQAIDDWIKEQEENSCLTN